MNGTTGMMVKKDCQKILFNIGIKLGVSPRLISERLLDAQDKCDMLNGDVSQEMLEIAVKLWMDAGKPDYASGCVETSRKP